MTADVNKPAANQSQVGVAEDDWQPPDLPTLGRTRQAKPKVPVQADPFTAANVVAPPPSESIKSEPKEVATGEGLEEEVRNVRYSQYLRCLESIINFFPLDIEA